ncbi:cilia- and flagella-associated protein 47-like isoform X8 [Branchiostoma floridae x Branchiostoma belcheri]
MGTWRSPTPGNCFQTTWRPGTELNQLFCGNFQRFTMEGDVAGVRINPPVVEFIDIVPNEQYKCTLTVQNISRASKIIKFHAPSTSEFKLKVRNPDRPVASGLEVTATVDFQTDKNEDCKDRVILLVDEDVVEIPLYAFTPSPIMVLHGPVDYGMVVADSRILRRETVVENHGSMPGEFKVKYNGALPITIAPTSGTVEPRSYQIIRIEFATKDPGTFEEEVEVRLEGQDPRTLVIKGCVVEQKLHLQNKDSEPLDCVKFGSTFYGTDCIETGYLYNEGPKEISFVAILDEGGVGEEAPPWMRVMVKEGVDLTKSTAATLAIADKERARGSSNPLTSLVTAIPNQGMIGPYQRVPIHFRFAPRFSSAEIGWKGLTKSPPRQDYALYMRFEMIGSREGMVTRDFLDGSARNGVTAVEVAITATALPILVNLSPHNALDFHECPVGEHVDALCTLRNESTMLPLMYKFRKIAHYSSTPYKGKIGPGEGQDLVFSFAPKQVGNLRSNMVMDIVGYRANEDDPARLIKQAVHSFPVELNGIGQPLVKKRDPRFNPGITPLVVGETGQFVDVTFSDTKPYTPRAAMLNSTKTSIHTPKTLTGSREDKNALVAYPNDRAGSIRPSDRREKYRTIFTKAERHTFVDPDYAYTEEEEQKKHEHKQKYIGFLREQRKNREKMQMEREFVELNNKVDMGMKPASGLRPPKVKDKDTVTTGEPRPLPNEKTRLLSTRELREAERTATVRPVSEGLNAVPTTPQEKSDCKKKLTPQELHQVVIGPPTIEFGEVCLRSTSVKELNIMNNLNQYIRVVVDIDCTELRQTSPLSQVVPPCAKAQLPLIFESHHKGRFQRSVMYTVNGHHTHHVLVMAEVVPVALELSTQELTVKPFPGMPADAGLRGTVTLHNRRNYPAEFQWHPILGERGMAFSIRPASGTVDAFKDLACEVVFHPSYLAPEEGEFNLLVNGGGTEHLKCFAKLGQTAVQFVERRILFGSVPINMTTTRTALLHNTSQHHAYFQVVDPNPFPGLTVSPIHGAVPVGGYAELKIELTPNAVIKFDTRIQVAIRGWKTVELRMGGKVDPPCVDIDMKEFKLGGVFCGSQFTIPFVLGNLTRTKTKAEFDLTRYMDFRINFLKQDLEIDPIDPLTPGMYRYMLEGEEIVPCELVFSPTEVASYDFLMPVHINAMDAPSPTPSSFPPTPAPSVQHIIPPRIIEVSIATPRRRIMATALRQPLQVSNLHLEFYLPPGFMELGIASDVGQRGSNSAASPDKKHIEQYTILVNNSSSPITWGLDLEACKSEALEEGTFKFLGPGGVPFVNYREKGIEGTLQPGETYELGVLFCPNCPGQFYAKVPIILNGKRELPYQYLQLRGNMRSPRVTFDPLQVVLMPVPLATEVSAEFSIVASAYTKPSSIKVEIPDIELDDGSVASVLKVDFPKGQNIQPCSQDAGQEEPFVFPCVVTFASPRPVSFSQPITFVDDEGRSFTFHVSATADNCVLSNYPFLAKHRTDHHIIRNEEETREIVVREGTGALGEAVIIPTASPRRPSTRGSTTGTSTAFGMSSSSYEETSNSVTGDTYPSSPREGAVPQLPAADSEIQQERQEAASRSLGSAAFPEEDSEEGIFHAEVSLSAQRWFSMHGWPGGPFPISIPQSLRKGVSRMHTDPDERSKVTSRGGSWDASSLKKEIKTVYDMITHLSGRPVPGIPINQPLPVDPTERVLQLHWQHATLLTFIKSQGGCVASIRPEYLMEPEDFRWWVKVQARNRQKEERRSREMAAAAGVEPELTFEEEAERRELEEVLFESVSKKAWSDMLLQLLKVLVLSRITPRQFKNIPLPIKDIPLPTVNPDPLASNIYSVGERILLAWLNHYYEHMRHKVWADCDKGGVPPSRWVVNFDFDLLDGLVLGAVLAAHVPFLIKTHLNSMYTHPSTPEQCLHNALKITSAFKTIGLDYDIQAIDITDPNPVAMLLLCVHLYQRLPHYLPKATVEFVGSLHATVQKEVRLTNPSSKPLIYHPMIAGRDARDFLIPKAEAIAVPPRGSHNLPVEFTSRLLRPAEAVLVLVGRRAGAAVGSTLVFNLRTMVDNITPKSFSDKQGNIKIESPCYELYRCKLNVTNPFDEPGDFRIVLVEAREPFPSPKVKKAASQKSSSAKSMKKIKSKIDHGQKKVDSPSPPPNDEKIEITAAVEKSSTDNTAFGSFFSPKASVHLEGHGSAEVEIEFLPFQTGHRQCSVLFINEEVGEFLYSIEASAVLPLPSVLPWVPSPHSVRISSAAAAGKGRGLFGGDDRVIYWKCENNSVLKENLVIPITNAARERSLVIAAQQRMSEYERERRKVAGTLASGTVTAAIAAMGLHDRVVDRSRHITTSHMLIAPPEGTTFNVQVSSPLFDAPTQVFVPSPLNNRPKPASEVAREGPRIERSAAGIVGNQGVILDDGTINIPIKFQPKGAGHYPCRIVLFAPNDVRVFQLEVIVNPDGSAAELEFVTPAHQSVSQDIPIHNPTLHDWELKAELEGDGFYGPPLMLARAQQTTLYPLMFRPVLECLSLGRLLLRNHEDGTEHIFNLKGLGQKPLALDHIVVPCRAREKVTKVVQVPNVSNRKLIYQVSSSLSCVSGAPTVTVLPGQTTPYRVSISPWQRGTFSGVITFVAGDAQKPREDDSSSDEDDELPTSPVTPSSRLSSFEGDADGDFPGGYRVWYSLEIQASPPQPEKRLQITCSAQLLDYVREGGVSKSAAMMEVPIQNPTNKELTLSVTIEGAGLSGEPKVTLAPGEEKWYQLLFAPTVVGKTRGSLIFYGDTVGEFWYDLDLVANTPAPKVLPQMECELGRWTRQFIRLYNPTDEPIELEPQNSNPNNFTLEVDPAKPVTLQPRSSLMVPLQFLPSALGSANHTAEITFCSEQLGDWVYLASGTGILPQPLDPVMVSAEFQSNTSLIIPFRNPFDEPVIVDVILTDQKQFLHKISESVIKQSITTESAFCLLLKHPHNIHLAPRATLDLPLTFAPNRMELHEAVCVVSVRREDGLSWKFAEQGMKLETLDGESGERSASRTSSGGLRDVRWIYPIHGVPESHPVKDAARAATVECQARNRVEERLEVTLMGAAPSSAGGYPNPMKTRAITPIDAQRPSTDGVIVGEGNTVAEEFSYEIEYDSEDAQSLLQHSLGLSLVRKQRDRVSGVVILVFNLIFAPAKPLRHNVELLVRSATGGVWRFPIRLCATEPTPDDIITIESVGLNKESAVAFRLTSQQSHPVAFHAYFVAGSDPEFQVSPQTGELLPLGTNGTQISISFTPCIYGKQYNAKLVIQTHDMQWTYNIRGMPQVYRPPMGRSSSPIAGPHPKPTLHGPKRNFLKENMQLITTGVSSPIKGTSILLK